MITADGGGSNGSRVRLWKIELQKLADETGLTVRCELDENTYAKGVKVSDAEMAALNISGDAFHPEWNYTIAPRSTPAST